MNRCRSAALLLASALAAPPALAQQGEPIGSWWLLDMSGEAAPRHAIPVETKDAIAKMRAACAKPAPAR